MCCTGDNLEQQLMKGTHIVALAAANHATSFEEISDGFGLNISNATMNRHAFQELVIGTGFLARSHFYRKQKRPNCCNLWGSITRGPVTTGSTEGEVHYGDLWVEHGHPCWKPVPKSHTKNPAAFTPFYKANTQLYRMAILGRNTQVFEWNSFKLSVSSSIRSWRSLTLSLFYRIFGWFSCTVCMGGHHLKAAAGTLCL